VSDDDEDRVEVAAKRLGASSATGSIAAFADEKADGRIGASSRSAELDGGVIFVLVVGSRILSSSMGALDSRLTIVYVSFKGMSVDEAINECPPRASLFSSMLSVLQLAFTCRGSG